MILYISHHTRTLFDNIIRSQEFILRIKSGSICYYDILIRIQFPLSDHILDTLLRSYIFNTRKLGKDTRSFIRVPRYCSKYLGYNQEYTDVTMESGMDHWYWYIHNTSTNQYPTQNKGHETIKKPLDKHT